MRVVFIILSWFAGGALFAQNLHNESIISIGTNGVLFVTDTIFNRGTIINNGDMQVGGSWINYEEYDAGEGKITFNSDLPQVINHNDQSFSRLTLSGGGEKLFLADITIDNELNLSDGILVSQNNSRIIISENAQVVGGSDASHIQGPVYRRGAGHKVFPVGNGGIYLPVEFLNVQGNSPEVGVTAIELDGTTLRASRSLKEISTSRYWQVDVVSGTLHNSRIVLPVKEETIVDRAEAAVVAEAASLDDDFESLGQLQFSGSTNDGRVTSDEVFTKSLLAVATASPGEGIIVYNAVSPNADKKNDYLLIENIEGFPGNKFSLFNRWGDKVFEIENYDNQERVFRGRSNIGGDSILSSGTYFYVIETGTDSPRINGFLTVRN